MEVKSNHPLAEILAKKLLGIEIVPQKEQRIMISRAIKAAVEWADKREEDIKLVCEAILKDHKKIRETFVEFGKVECSCVICEAARRLREDIK